MPCQFVTSSVSMRTGVMMMLWIIIGSINLCLGDDPGPPNQPPPNPPPPSGPPPPRNPPPPPDPQNSTSSPAGTSSTKQMPNQQSTTTERPDPRCGLGACPTKTGNYNFPIANNCSQYYWCRGNSAPDIKSCGKNQMFDKDSALCVNTSDASVCLRCPTTGTSPAYASVPSSSTVISSTSTRSPLPSSSSMVTSSSSTGLTSSGTLDTQFSSSKPVTNVSFAKTDAPKSGTGASLPTASMPSSATSSTSTSTENTSVSENPGSSVSSPISVPQTTIVSNSTSTDNNTTGNYFDTVPSSSSSIAVPSSFTTAAGGVGMPTSSDVSLESGSTSSVKTSTFGTGSSSATMPSSSTGKTGGITLSGVSFESDSTSSAKTSDETVDPSSIAVHTQTTSSAVPLFTKLQSRNIYFTSRPSDIVVEGTSVEFQCKFIWRTEIGGTARLDKFLWVLNGRELDATGRISINHLAAPLSDGSYVLTLRFSPVLSGDAGNLTCCAITSGFMNTTSISYQVFVKPRVSIDPGFVSARPGDAVLLHCTAVEVSDIDDFPVSVYRITWLRNERTILFTDELANSSFPVVSVFNGTFLQSTNVTCVLELSLVSVTSGVAFVHITADDNGPGCRPQTTSGVDWFFTKVGDSNFRPCPGNKTGSAVRVCAAADMWDQPDLSNCISKTLIDLKQQVDVVQGRTTALDNRTMTNLSVIVFNTVVNQVNMTEAEFQLIVEIIADMADIHVNSLTNTFLDKNELLTMMKTVSVLLGFPDSDKISKSSAVLLLSSVDIYTSLYAKQIDSDSVFSMYPNMVVETGGFSSLKSTSQNSNEQQIPSWNKIDDKQLGASLWANAKDNGIRVNPITGLGASASSNYTSSCIRNLGNMMPLTEGQIRNNCFINSYLVSLTVIGLNSRSIPPVVITLDHLRVNKSMFGKCVYWNFSSSANGSWMDNGCKTVVTNDSHTTCNCSHLTNFAILMSPNPATGMDDVILSIISLVGCIVSVIALLLTFLLYVSQWKKMKSKRAIVLLNLCISLIFANIIFLAGSNQTQSEIGCKVVAALLHYFFLAAFFLMLLEGILLLMYVICVFYVHRKSHTIVLLVSAWFLPAIIVAVSLGVTKTDGYGTENTCWLSVKKNVLWAFVGPALFVILVNLVIIIIVLIRIGSAKVRSDLKKKKNKIVSVLRNVVILSPILGVTWIFGVLSVNNDTLVFQYIFCIANTLQGLYIFILHGLCHAKNKKSSSVSSKPKRWTGPPSRISAQRAHIPLSEGDSQEDLVRSNKAEKELYLEQNIVKENSMYKVPYAHQLSNMSHVSNGTASTCVSNSLSANGMASPH